MINVKQRTLAPGVLKNNVSHFMLLILFFGEKRSEKKENGLTLRDFSPGNNSKGGQKLSSKECLESSY